MRYFIVGVSTVILDLVSLIFLKWLGLTAVLAVAINQFFVFGYNFELNKIYSFQDKNRPQRQIIRYLTVAGLNYIVAVGMMYILHDVIGWDYRLVRLITIALATLYIFPLYKYWVYR